MFEKNVEKVCQSNNITGKNNLMEVQEFQYNLSHYK